MFFDNASTTKIDESILDQFKDLNDELFYNPGALYAGGRRVKQFIENFRSEILKTLNGSGKIVFTGSATEANNLAILGCLKKNTKKILVSIGEHPSVYETALEIKNRGFNVEFVKLNRRGTVDIDDFKAKMTEDVDFISILHVSNETGAVNDIRCLVEYAKEINPKVVFHSDGVQAVGKVEVDLEDLGVDLYTMSSHKIHGMKGSGALFVKSGVALKPIVYGGGQEFGLRSGTENVLTIYSLTKAIENSCKNLSQNFANVSLLKTGFLEKLSDSGLDYVLHSDELCSPYIISIAFKNCRAETLLNMLSDKNVFVGNGSACSSKKSGNRILESMGVAKTNIEGNLRISFSRCNTIDEVCKLCFALIDVVTEYLNNTK